jgi:serine/threonine protein kinase
MARQIVWSLLSAVRYLHSRGVVHRRLHAGNLLLHSDRGVVLSGFSADPAADCAEKADAALFEFFDRRLKPQRSRFSRLLHNSFVTRRKSAGK